jgi:xylose isomerase
VYVHVLNESPHPLQRRLDMPVPTPTPADKFTFGLWTVGWQARDPFGDATRPELDPVESVHRLAELGAYGVTFHDDDLVPFGSEETERRRHIDRFTAALKETGLTVPMMTTNLFTHPVFKDGGLTSNDRSIRRYAMRKVMRNMDLGRRDGRRDVRAVGRSRGLGDRRRQGRRAALDRYREGLDLLAQYSEDRGYGLRFALEPKPNEPRGDILLPTIGHALASSPPSSTPSLVGPQPRGRARADVQPQLRARHRPGAVAGQALPHRPERPARPEVRPGPHLRPRRPAQRLLPGRPARERRTGRRPLLRGPAALRLQAAAHRGHDGVWASGRGNMRTYLLLKERAAAFRADPRCRRRLAAPACPSWRRPRTPGDGETYEDLLADRAAFEDYERRGRRAPPGRPGGHSQLR